MPELRQPPYPTVLKPYGQSLVALAKERDDIVCLTGDLSKQCEIDLFADAYPERFIHAGMAEANMMGVAGALARDGFVPFVHTFGTFATRRPLDQVINSIAFPNLRVRIMGFMPGVSSPGGPSHQAIDDVALMRAVPNMTVVDVADAVEVRQVANAIVDVDGPVYVRLKRGEIPVIFGDDHRLRLDRADVLTRGEDVALFASGMMLAPALAAARLLGGPRRECLGGQRPGDQAAGRRHGGRRRREREGRRHRGEPHRHRRPRLGGRRSAWRKPASAGRCAASACATRSPRAPGPARTCSASTGCRSRRSWTPGGRRSAAATRLRWPIRSPPTKGSTRRYS